MQIPSSPSNKKISELIGMIRRGELILQPEFQRKLVWSTIHKEAFIETILMGYPFPEIYIAQKGIDLDTMQTQQVVVDGQQRLSTIIGYFEGKEVFKKVRPYSELNKEEKEAFGNYDVVVRDLKDAAPEHIREIFRRINLTKYSLEPIEVNNAVYDGAYINTAKTILDSIDVESFDIFSERELSRMSDLNYILLIMSTIEEGGYFVGNKKTEEYIQRYNDYYPNAEKMSTLLIRTFALIKDLSLSPLSIWFRKSNFLTLFVELYNVNNAPTDLRKRLDDFENRVLESKVNQEDDYGHYYAAMYTGTNSRSARVIRSVIFRKYILGVESSVAGSVDLSYT